MLSYKGFARKALAVALISGMCFASFQTPATAAPKKLEKTKGNNGEFGFDTKEEVIVTKKVIKKELPISQRYDATSNFMGGVAFVQTNNAWGLINKMGVEIVPVTNMLKGGKSVDDKKVYKFTEGFISFTDMNGMSGFINSVGRVVVPAKYDVVGDFKNGHAVVGKYVPVKTVTVDKKTKKKVTKTVMVMKYTAINRYGKELTKFEYDSFWNFNGGFAKVEKAGKYGKVNVYGKTVIPVMYNYLEDYEYGFLKANLNGKLGLINAYNKTILAFNYDMIEGFGDGLGEVKGVKKIKNLAKVHVKGKVGLINQMGKVVLKPSYFDVSEFGKNFAVVTKKNPKSVRVGLVDKTGKLVVETIYDRFENLNGSYVKIWDQKRVGLVNPMGKIVVRPIYDSITTYMSNGLAKMSKDKKFGLVDMNGVEVVAPKYDMIKDLVGGYMEYKKGKEVGYLDATGKVVKKVK